jgi:hypothetical protein
LSRLATIGVRRRVWGALLGVLCSALGVFVVPGTAGAHEITAPVAEYGGSWGIYGFICGHKGTNKIGHSYSSGWLGQARTALQVGIPCWYDPAPGCCVAGTVETAVEIQRANGSFCPEIDYQWNPAGDFLAWATIYDGCGAPASGSKRTRGWHSVDIYGSPQNVYYATAYHASI